ncbi:hypothetical protein GCM10010466_65580 [Planomonospora alba]|uniref:ZIP family metal transporter n=1 Tax=Planomonospora alba TaxID=161354 RepID=A0ABP6P354_9ACTN
MGLRAAVIFGAAVIAGAGAISLVRADGKSWPAALLAGGAAFSGALPLANSIIV